MFIEFQSFCSDHYNFIAENMSYMYIDLLLYPSGPAFDQSKSVVKKIEGTHIFRLSV